MIAALLAPPGYGKTHLFGRIAHQLGNEVCFVFVPALEERKAPLDHVLWHTVEALFQAPEGGHSTLARALARLCRPALADYFQRLPPTLAARHQPMRQRLQESAEAVLDVVRPVAELGPFRQLADSLVNVLATHHAGVVRALACGWAPHPWSGCARRWLRGESLPEAELAALGLDDDPPSALDVLRALPALFEWDRPLVICCDQVESLLKGRESDATNLFTTALMEVLQEVPVQLVMSCLEDKWVDLLGQAFGAFKMRVRAPFTLATLKEEQAVRLVRNRIATWPGAKPERGAACSFDEASVMQLTRDHGPTPRALIQTCAAALDDWLPGERDKPIVVGPPQNGPDLDVLFLREWKSVLEAVPRDPNRSAENQPEERIYRGVFEVLNLALSARREMGGVRVRRVDDDALGSSLKPRRLAARVEVSDGATVVVALTKLENARAFRFHFDALSQAFNGPAAGAVLIHPKRDFPLGAQTREAFDAAQKQGKLRLFPLEDNPTTYAALECLVTLLQRADAQELQLGNDVLTAEDCRDLVLKTGVIDQLDLFKALGGWRQPAAVPRVARPVMVVVGKEGTTTTGVAVAPTPRPTPAPAPVVPAPVADLTAWAEKKLAEVEKKLKMWGLPVEPDGHEIGPAFARLKVRPSGNKTTYKSVCNKAEDLKIHLGLVNVPIIGSQAGYISVDVQRPSRALVTLDEALTDGPEGLDDEPVFPVGKDVAGATHWLNLAEPSDCHVLVAGTTGSGKSEFLRTLVAALASRLSPQQLQFVLVDPKRVTFNFKDGESPYLRAPVARDLDEALPLVEACLQETRRRYELLEEQKQSNVAELASALLPRIVVIIDEFANLMKDTAGKKALPALLKQIGSMARAAGIHLVLATQRPDKDVVTPLLRDNLPGRIALKVPNKASSELILSAPDAAHLLGKGDLIWMRGGGLLRLQAPFTTQAELEERLKLH